MTCQVGGELASIDQHRTQLALETLHQFLSPLLEFAITAVEVEKILDGDPVDELGDEGIDLARPEGESGRHEDAR